jgi:hypothetical protein
VRWFWVFASLLVPGVGFVARRDVLTFVMVLVTVVAAYASYRVLVAGYPMLTLVPTSYHYLPVLGGALHVGAALRMLRPDPGRKP